MIIFHFSGAWYAEAEVPSIYIDISAVEELNLINVSETHLEIGAAVTLASLIDVLKQHQRDSVTFQPLRNHIENVATDSVRNVRFNVF